MSFFSSLLSPIFGGSQQSSQQTQSSGYGALPSFAQDAYKNLVDQATKLFSNGSATSAYTPLPQTSAETTAYGMEKPMTADSINSLVSNYMNPFMSYAIQPILNQFNNANSLYQQQAAQSGLTPGTNNRDFLNTAYLQGQEGQAIGSTLGNEYNTALTTGLTQNQLTIDDLLQQGANQRNLYADTQRAPMNALQAYGQTLGFFPSSSVGQSNSSQSSTPGLMGALAAFAPK